MTFRGDRSILRFFARNRDSEWHARSWNRRNDSVFQKVEQRPSICCGAILETHCRLRSCLLLAGNVGLLRTVLQETFIHHVVYHDRSGFPAVCSQRVEYSYSTR